jgi:hypothetical protein
MYICVAVIDMIDEGEIPHVLGFVGERHAAKLSIDFWIIQERDTSRSVGKSRGSYPNIGMWTRQSKIMLLC